MHESEKWKWSRSVVPDSQRPHGLQPTRLLHPWDFPGKSTGAGCHCLLQSPALAYGNHKWDLFFKVFVCSFKYSCPTTTTLCYFLLHSVVTPCFCPFQNNCHSKSSYNLARFLKLHNYWLYAPHWIFHVYDSSILHLKVYPLNLSLTRGSGVHPLKKTHTEFFIAALFINGKNVNGSHEHSENG